MIKWKLWISAFVLAGVALVVGATRADIVFEQGNSLHKDAPVLMVENLRRQYAAVKSVHLVADAKIVVYGKDFAVGTGSFEYWAADKRYRIRCRTDKQLKLNSDVDVAYDGKQFQFFDLAAGVLSVRSTDDFRSHAALPNPFFLPVDFLSQSGDDCPLCRLRFIDVKSDNERWASRAQEARVTSKRHDATNGLITEVEMPGSTVHRTPSKLRIKTQGPDAERSLPSQIERVDMEGRVRASVSFKHFIEDGSFQIPREMSISVYDDKGNLTFRLEYVVKLLEINRPLDNQSFTISLNNAEAVWDSDARKFIKEKRP